MNKQKGWCVQKSENKRKVFGIVVLYGFETKNFFGSGLYGALVENSNVVVLRRQFPTKNFAEYIAAYNLNVKELDNQIAKKRFKSEDLFLASRRARQRIRNIGNFNYFKADRQRKASDFLIGSDLIYKLLGQYVTAKLVSYYHDQNLEKMYDDCQMTDLILPGYSSTESIALANTALQSGRNVWLVINSWKDFYVNDFIPFTPTKTFVWSRQMKDQILASNAHIDAADVIISGNPSFDRFFHYAPVQTKQYYAQKYRFDAERPLILYSMISPKAYESEKEIIERISVELTAVYPDEQDRPLILLRRNPIDETVADEAFFSGNNVRYADNYFDDTHDNSVFVQLQEGEREWLDLLCHADININIASTVTLEALMMQTPVINIEFDADGKREERLTRYTTAPFYTPLLGRQDICIAQTIEQCIEAIESYLKNETPIGSLSPILDNFDGLATRRMMRGVNHG
jgi:hypothetical protein